jgi:hypothetical protein
MLNGIQRLVKWAIHGENYGVRSPEIFTDYELKLLAALSLLAGALLWSLARQDAAEGAAGLALIAGIAVYLSYAKYYRTYKPAMDRWGIRELCSPQHPRQEYRVAERDLLISPDEVKFIALQQGVKLVCHKSDDNPNVQVYELSKNYEHRLRAEKWRATMDQY